MILDLYSRKVIGWGVSRRIDTNLALSALQMAIARRQPGSPLLKSDIVALLKRFRNAVFHFQKDLESEKLLVFLEKPETEMWTQQVFKAFGRFFLEQSEKFFEKAQG